MSIYHGADKIRDEQISGVYYGLTPVCEIYRGSQRVYHLKKNYSFYPSNLFQIYVVPKWITKIHVDCVASRGSNGSTTSTERAGKGGRVECELTVTPGQTLYIYVGSIPADLSSATYNASDVRTNNAGVTDTTSLQSRLIVAGGGGGSLYPSPNRHYYGNGGDGGGLTGGDGTFGGYDSSAGTGGTQTAGGSRGGTFGLGAASGNSVGGAGWYGGGYGTTTGHNSVFYTGGGGGGSSYTDDTVCSNVTHTQGYRDGEGYITITEIG